MKSGPTKKNRLNYWCIAVIMLVMSAMMESEQALVKEIKGPGGDAVLTRAGRQALRLIQKQHPIDSATFRDTTPSESFQYWVSGLRRYEAMDKDWLACDPPGPPLVFIVTPDKKVFMSASEALQWIKHAPADKGAALRAAVMIALMSSPRGSRVMVEDQQRPEGIPENVLRGLSTRPDVSAINNSFAVTLYSNLSTESENKFVRGRKTLWKHLIFINGYNYSEKITIIWDRTD